MQYLTMALRDDHKRAGLYLEEDHHHLWLKQSQKTVAKFHMTTPLIEIQAAASRHIKPQSSKPHCPVGVICYDTRRSGQ